MHTYNDALRQTIGSYVLYPGTETGSAEKISKFHEIAPGVGALVMKPGNLSCLDAFKAFMIEMFEHQSDNFSQYRYVADTGYQTYSDPPEVVEEAGDAYHIARKSAPCILLYVPKQSEETFKRLGFAYCRVDSTSGKALNLDLSIEVGSEFIPYGGARS